MMDLRDQNEEGGSLNIAVAFSGEVEWTGRLVYAVILMCGLWEFAAWGIHSNKSILIIPPNTHDRPTSQYQSPQNPNHKTPNHKNKHRELDKGVGEGERGTLGERVGRTLESAYFI